MHAFTTTVNSYFNANKVPLFVLLLIVNGIMLSLAKNAQIDQFGKVEALGYKWTTYTKLHKDELESRVTYSKISDTEINTKSINYEYEYAVSKDNKYISLGYDKPVTIRHNRIFFIDENCGLFFSGRAKRTLKNMAFRCLVDA